MQNSMNDNPKLATIWRKFLFILSLIIFILMGTISLVDYRIAKLILYSILAGTGVVFLLSFIFKRWGWKGVFYALGALAVALTLPISSMIFYIGLNPLTPPCNGIGQIDIVALRSYRGDIEVNDLSQDKFIVNASIVYDVKRLTCMGNRIKDETIISQNVEEDLPEKIVYAIPKGLFLREFVLPLNSWTSLSNAQITDAPESINIHAFPYRSFYDANVEKFDVEEYLGSEWVSWESKYTSREIRFVYIQPPYHNLRTLLLPLIEMSKYDNKILASLGFILPFLVFSIISPVVINALQNKLRGLAKKQHHEERKIKTRKKNPN